MTFSCGLSLLCAATFALSLVAASGDDAPVPQMLAGDYALGEGSNLTLLSLRPDGQFVMRSRKDLGDQVGPQVQGVWQVKNSNVTLRSTSPNHPFFWRLKMFSRAKTVDLVPEELVSVYQEAPLNAGTRYRRYANASDDDQQTLIQTAARSEIPSERIERSPKDESNAAPEKPIPTARIKVSPPKPPKPPKPRTEQQPTVDNEPAVFIYQPAPSGETRAVSSLRPGLARLSVDTRGHVKVVTILQSTGQPQFDDEAAETLHRWRTQPGPAREIEVPLTTVLKGKRAPTRIPLTSGSMTSG